MPKDDTHLRDCHILVAEDEYMLAVDLCDDLRNAGANCIGPAGTVEDAVRLAKDTRRIDAAILDINLRGEMNFATIDILIERRVPTVLVTGYDLAAVPERYNAIARCDKPVDSGKIFATLNRLIAGAKQ